MDTTDTAHKIADKYWEAIVKSIQEKDGASAYELLVNAITDALGG